MAERRKRNIVGAQVRRLRGAAKLTQDELAARGSLSGFDIGRASVSHIETGLRGVSDLEMVLLANALRVSMDPPTASPRTENQESLMTEKQTCSYANIVGDDQTVVVTLPATRPDKFFRLNVRLE